MSDTDFVRPQQGAADLLALGFGATLAMWAIGYLTHLPGVTFPQWLVLVLLAVILLCTGVLAGRLTPRGWLGGLQAGLIAGLVNTLILGSVVGKQLAHGPGTAGLALLVSVLVSGVVAAVGAAAVQRQYSPLRPPPDWTYVFAIVAAGAMLLLIFAGGLVTSLAAGLAVPDWPTSFGRSMFFLPLADMTGGVYFEHAHRLLGSLVGLTTLVLLIHLLRGRWNSQVKTLAGLVFLLVCVQGVLGGLRVTDKSVALAVVHGITAQVIFALLAALVTQVSPAYRAAARSSTSGLASARRLAYWLCGILLVQLVLGTLYRQSDNISSHWGMAHMTLAVVVVVVAMFAGLRASKLDGAPPALVRAGKGVLHVVGLQFLLGILAVVLLAILGQTSPAAAVVATVHQTNGALLLGAGARLLAWVRRLS